MSTEPFLRAAYDAINEARVQTLVRNKLIPRRAVASEEVARGVRYLHPTKGWRFVSNRRFRAYTA